MLAATPSLGDGFDSFLDGGSGVPAESSVLAPEQAPGPLSFGEGAGVIGEGDDSSAFVGGTPDGRVVYPGSEPGFIPYGGGADGGFGAWYGPVENVGRGLFLPVSPRWIVQTDALFLWQGNIGSRPLYLNDYATTTVPNPSPPPAGTPTTALDINQTAPTR